jgi:hypothetical protein
MLIIVTPTAGRRGYFDVSLDGRVIVMSLSSMPHVSFSALVLSPPPCWLCGTQVRTSTL